MAEGKAPAGSISGTTAGRDLEAAYHDFCDKGNEITTANCQKCFKKAGLLGKKCTSNSLDIAFSKVKTDKKKKFLNFAEFKSLIKTMAADYGADHKLSPEDAERDMIDKVTRTRNIASGTKISVTGNVSGLTDTSKYTGSHKERFDADGKGKGLAGRENIVANDGYVGNYKDKDTWDKKHEH